MNNGALGTLAPLKVASLADAGTKVPDTQDTRLLILRRSTPIGETLHRNHETNTTYSRVLPPVILGKSSKPKTQLLLACTVWNAWDRPYTAKNDGLSSDGSAGFKAVFWPQLQAPVGF